MLMVILFAGYVAELVANWFIGSGIPLPVIKRLLTQHDRLRKKKQQIDMEVVEAEEMNQIEPEEAPPCEEEVESGLDNYNEIFGTYLD